MRIGGNMFFTDYSMSPTMAHPIYSHKLRDRTNRLKLPVRKKPYKVLIAPGIFLCYRRNAGPGTWSVEAGWLKRFALADDHEEANGKSVMSFWQASKHALKMVRGSEGDADKPVTVHEALVAYQADLEARGGIRNNATSLRTNLSSAMLSKVVMLLTETELQNWRNDLVAAGLKVSSVNRYSKSFKAALTLAANRDKRITNRAVWKAGLKALKAKGGNQPPRTHYYLPDNVILAIVREAYADDDNFGALIDTMSQTGARESQVLRCWPDDIRDENPDVPRLMVPCSNKGKGREPEQRAIPITPRLAKLLRARAINRGNKPLFDAVGKMSANFRAVLERLDLDLTLTPYSLRHSSIIRQIRNGTPLRLIAFAHDTSVTELERTYARYLNNASDDLIRSGLLADLDEAPAGDNVIKLR
jgi:integrase